MPHIPSHSKETQPGCVWMRGRTGFAGWPDFKSHQLTHQGQFAFYSFILQSEKRWFFAKVTKR